jgi:RNA polymerase sigma-70 factor, ECF subfamily
MRVPAPENVPDGSGAETGAETGADRDAELIARWRAGDDRAATELVGRHADALARFATSLGERSEIEELVQDTFVRAFASLDSFRGDSSLRTWLFTIQRRLVVDRRRSERRQRHVISIEGHESATEYTALDAVVADETGKRLEEAMRRLSPLQREVFSLRVGEGLAYREIADIVGSTEGAARVHYHNAMRAVKEYLDD